MKKTRIFLVAALVVLVGASCVSGVWRGYDDFDSFSRAADIDEFLGQKLNEAELGTLALLGSLFSDDIHLDVVSDKMLAERYHVPARLRSRCKYLVKRSGIKGTKTYCARYTGTVWIVAYWPET